MTLSDALPTAPRRATGGMVRGMDEQTTGPAGPEDVIIAVGDPGLEQEAATIVAATGRRAIRVDSPDPSDAGWRRCAAILIDSGEASAMLARVAAGDGARPAREGLFLVHSDDSGPPDGVADELGCGEPVPLPSCGAELVGRIGRPGAVRAGRVIACAPAVGGAGASVCAAVTAMAAARAERDGDVLLIDADEWSGGADLLLGAEAEPGVRWPDVRADAGALDAGALFAAVPLAPVRGRAGEFPGASGERATGILTGPRSRADDGWTVSPRAVAAVIDAVVGSGGTAVVDLPAAGPIAEAVVPRADVLALVVPATVRGLAAAARRAAALRRLGGDPVAVVRWPAPGGVTIDDIEFATGLNVVAELPHVRGLEREIEVDGLGRSVGKLMRPLAPLLDLAGDHDAGHRW